ncbi:MAG: amino acid ABC transporter substrate-binding protein [Acidimicrobiales bacterium]|nr:amino acid ABC transporter substrate-binding protein [Acidimicrobiales bacterium]MYK71218.1 amino acid ABC transporter substrate-binding protein [Acidimicrobiales bacterium]
MTAWPVASSSAAEPHDTGDPPFGLHMTWGRADQPAPPRARPRRWLAAIAVLASFALCGLTSCTGEAPVSEERQSDSPVAETLVRYGFYAYFEPVSALADSQNDQHGERDASDSGQQPSNRGGHIGYEADLLSAIEAMDGFGLRFVRSPITEWPGIWLMAASDSFDMTGGGITALDSRTRDADGATVIAFTEPHIEFRQSLLVRSADAERIRSHGDLLATDRVGVLASTTGEARLLQLLDITHDGRLAPGTRVHTPAGVVLVADDGRHSITASGASADLADRTRLEPADPNLPDVVYLGELAGEQELLDSLSRGDVDAIARGTIGNAAAAFDSDGEFAVTALDQAVEHGGFAIDAANAELRSAINTAVAWLTDNGRIGITQWIADNTVFATRARQWQPPG